jgi:phage-related minor tail protein
VSDFRLNVIAETQAAERKLQQVDKLATAATKSRKFSIDLRSLNKDFSNIQNDIKAASNNIRTFYSISKNIPGVGDKVREFESLAKTTAATAKQQFQFGTALKESAQAGSILSRSLTVAGTVGGRLIDVLAKVGFATFALKEAVGVVQAAWNGFFNNTIGREIKLRETILKTQTTLASTNRVFAGGKEITDPYQKIVSLTGAVAERIDSIRERSIALAGVTSNDVIEVFGIVASQVGQIGGGLKDAEDLAISFSAALGTFGLPLEQARQEIGSILRGDVGPDSYLAQALGINSADIARAKTEVGGVVKFLETKLAASVAGQAIAAQGFAGVISNIADLGELIGQNFGRGLLDPLLGGLTSVFETLFKIRTQIFAIAEGAGQAIGRAGQLVVGLTAGRTGIGAGDPSRAASAAASVAQQGFNQIELVAQRTVGALTQAIEALKPTALILVDAFRNIAEAFVRIKVGTFEALASALANIASVVGAISQPLAGLFNLYSRFLNTPAVQYFSEVAAVLGLLKRVGLDAATQLVLFGRFIVGAVIPAIGGLGTALAGLVGAIAAVVLAVGKLIVLFAGLATALVGPAAAIPALAAGLKALSVELLTVGKQAVTSGTQLNGLAAGFRGLGAGAKAAGASILASLGWIAVIQIGIAVVIDAFGRFQRAQEDQQSNARAAEALRRLQTTYKDVGDSADSATKAARDFEQAIVNANYSRNLDQLEEVRKKINQIRYELKPGIQSWGEFWDALSGSEVGRFEERSRQVLGGLLKEEAKIKAELRGVDAQRDREQAIKDIQLQAQNRTNLEREIADLRRQLENDLFQQREALAQKEVDIFRAAGELRIKQIERANAKLIEGEEGASRAALEALNNYIATRERGELEIEAAKQTIAIEVTSLEKAISDYRYDTEKKIAELRKKSADYERDSADARRRAGVAGPPAPTGPSGALSQLIGGHESYGGNYGAFNRGGSNQGHTAHGSGIDPNLVNMTIAEIQRRQLAPNVPRNQQLHAVGKYQIIGSTLRSLMSGGYGPTGVSPSDKFSPAVQEKLFEALARNRVVPGDIAATERGLKQEWIGLQYANPGKLRAATQQLMGGGAGAATPAAAPAGGSELPDASAAADNYATAVRSLAGAMEHHRSLQAAITEANTAEAFDEFAKAAFPQVAIEQYQDQLLELQANYDALTRSDSTTFSPERAALESNLFAQRATAARELQQILDGIAKQTKLNDTERTRAIEAVNTKHAQYLRGLDQEALLKQRILSTEQATNFIQQTRDQARSIYEDIEALKLRNSLQAEGVAPEFIAAEIAKLDIQREVNRLTTELSAQLTTELALRDELQQKIAATSGTEKAELEKQLAAALATIERLRKQIEGVGAAGRAGAGAEDARAKAATEPGTRIRGFIGDAQRQLEDLEGVAITVSQGIGDAVGNALTNGITGLIEGTTTAKEVFSSFLKDIGQILMQEAAKMIATYIAIGIAKQFAGLFGGGAGGAKPPLPGSFPLMAAKGAYFDGGTARFAKGGVVSSPTLFQFADGGAVQTGLMGEAGPEAIMPLKRGPDGKLGVTARLDGAMGRYRGAAGGFVGSGGVMAEAARRTAPMEPIDVRYSVERINNVDYVTADQFQRGMAQAAQQGAVQGERRAMRSLKNSSSVRRSVGI